MAIYKRGGTYWYEFQFNGQRIQQSARTGNKDVARQIEAAHRVGLAKGEAGIQQRPAAPTLAEFAPRFESSIETLCAEKPATISFYRQKVRQLLADRQLSGARLNTIDEALIDGYKQRRTRAESRRKRPLSPASVNRELATLRRLLRLAQEWKVIDRVPRIRLLRGEREREFVFDRQTERLYLTAAEAYPDLWDVATLLIDTGLRIGECLKLEWPDVRLEPAVGARHGYLTVRRKNAKNSKARNVPLTSRAVEVLQRRNLAACGLVFHRADEQPLYQTWLNEQHATIRKLLKLPADCVPHSFRHTYGTRLGETGADAFTIMRLMGHSTVTVSQRYVHPTPEAMENAVSRMEAYNQAVVPAKVPTERSIDFEEGKQLQ
jgi:integrase